MEFRLLRPWGNTRKEKISLVVSGFSHPKDGINLTLIYHQKATRACWDREVLLEIVGVNVSTGYSRNLGHSTNIATEVWGLLDVLLQAHLLAIQFLEVEIDSQIIVDLTHSHDTDSHSFVAIISYCMQLLRTFMESHLQYSFRKVNTTVNLLARQG